MATWATIDQVAEWLGVPENDRMLDALAAAQSWAEHIRPDLLALVDPETVEPNITHAVVLYAALLYRERTSPAGFSGYDVDGGGDFANQSAMTNIYRLLGSRKPVAR